MMIIDTLKKRFGSLTDTVIGFPLVTAIVVVISALLTRLTWHSFLSEETGLRNVVIKMIAVLCVVVFGIASVSKRYYTHALKRRVYAGLVLLAGFVYYMRLPDDLATLHTGLIIQHVLVQIGAVFSLLVVPLFSVDRTEKSMFGAVTHLLLHAGLAVLFALLLATGLNVALWGVESLFSLRIAAERHATIFAVVGTIFGGLSFLDGIRTWEMTHQTTYHKEKRNTLLGWVIGILLLIYALILYSYLAKILITWQRPSNQVTLWSYVFSALVVVASIILVPLIESEKLGLRHNKVLTWLYASLIPVMCMVACAIRLRVQQYGLTEQRYLVIAILVWLLLSSVYMFFSKRKDLWYVAALLFVFIVVAAVGGPLSARVMSRESQLASLQALIADAGLSTEQGVLSPQLLNDAPSQTRQRVAGIIQYITNHHGSERISSFTQNASTSLYDQLLALGLNDLPSQGMKQSFWFNTTATGLEPIDISGYNRVYEDFYSGDRSTLDAGIITVEIDDAIYTADFSALAKTLYQQHRSNEMHGALEITPEQMRLETSNALFIIKSLSIKHEPSTHDADQGTISIVHYAFDLYTK